MKLLYLNIKNILLITIIIDSEEPDLYLINPTNKNE